jgi:hypothetical protein
MGGMKVSEVTVAMMFTGARHTGFFLTLAVRGVNLLYFIFFISED